MEQMSSIVPPIDRPEWKKMITGEIEHSYKNYVLQLQSSNLRKKVEKDEISINEAVEEMHALCTKYYMAVRNDFIEIFKTW